MKMLKDMLARRILEIRMRVNTLAAPIIEC